MSFETDLEQLIAVEVAQCKMSSDRERLARCLVNLCDAVGTTICIVSGGDKHFIKSGCEVASESISKRAIQVAHLAQLLLADREEGVPLQ